jgi:hypothetical protein
MPLPEALRKPLRPRRRCGEGRSPAATIRGRHTAAPSRGGAAAGGRRPDRQLTIPPEGVPQQARAADASAGTRASYGTDLTVVQRTNTHRATWLVLRWNGAVQLQEMFGVSARSQGAGTWPAGGGTLRVGGKTMLSKEGAMSAVRPVGRSCRSSPFAGDHAGVPRRQSTAQQWTTLPR